MEKNHRKPNRKKLELIKRELAEYDAVVITGASSGIGRGIVELIDEVSHVRLCNISRSFPSFLSDRKDFLHVPCDLKNSAEISAAIPRIFGFIGAGRNGNPPKILLVNNSGFGAYGEFPEPSVSRNCEMVDVNVRAVAMLCGEFADAIRAGRGSIINIASTAAFQACPQLAVYAATKSFVKSFTLGISHELRKHGCKCLCVCPGPTSSNFFRAAGFDTPPLPSGFGHEPRDVAEAALEALARGKILKIVGRTNFLQCAATRFVPTALLVKISGFVLERIRSMK